ncbi:MAG: DUF1385 domain-containing protein [Anaerolineae bacterium]|nr:DUF1385 domain-containing protein [Anaerolineae bacterium]
MSEEFNYGGQAVIEGVMMRGSQCVAVAVRNPAGAIDVKVEPLNPVLYRSALARIPVLRGLTVLWDALGLGMKALLWSAEVSAGDELEEGAFEGPLGWGTAAVSLTIGVLLFMVFPSLVVGVFPELPSLAGNLIEGVIRIVLMLGYIWAVGRIPDIQRVYAYHGAEHKTINAYEDGAPLVVEAVRPYTTAHPRCGTAFLLNVAVISLLVLAPLGRPSLLIRVLSRIALVPLIAGLSYEVIRFSARHGNSPWLRWLIRPSLALQRLTTREPDDGMVEVAIEALKVVLKEEGRPVPLGEAAG